MNNSILLADDESGIRTALSHFLESNGYVVHQAADGVEAMAQIRKHNPDLILLDLVMPRMDGIEVCKALRLDIRSHLAHVIMLTARNETEDKVEALEIGADDYITKPFDPAELLARVKAGLRNVKSRKMACLDGLTGLYNKNFMDRTLFLEVEKARNDNQSLCFAMLELDSNEELKGRLDQDQYNQVLVDLAQVVMDQVHFPALPFAWSPGMVVLVFPGFTLPQATQVVESIRQIVEHLPQVPVTISAGVTDFDGDSGPLFNRVDQALRQAKEGGKNRVESLSSPLWNQFLI